MQLNVTLICILESQWYQQIIKYLLSDDTYWCLMRKLDTHLTGFFLLNLYFENIIFWEIAQSLLILVTSNGYCSSVFAISVGICRWHISTGNSTGFKLHSNVCGHINLWTTVNFILHKFSRIGSIVFRRSKLKTALINDQSVALSVKLINVYLLH